MLRRLLPVIVFGFIAVALVIGGRRLSAQAAAPTNVQYPVFEVDPAWPKLPNNWVLGAVAAVTTDKRDHVWILHRPLLVPEAQRANAAPPVLEFDNAGKFIRAWGGPSATSEWPSNEHGITVDYKGNIWISGNNVGDDMLLKFTLEGKYISEIGKKGASTGNQDTVNVNRPADLYVWPKTNEIFVADGYGNRRVIVFDADTGKFKRMWGAFGNPPDTNPAAGSAAANAAAAAAGGGRGGRGRAAADGAAPGGGGAAPADGAGGGGRRGRGGAAPAEGGAAAPAAAPARGRGGQVPNLDTSGDGPQTFANPVHVVKISNDNLVYVGDRSNRRIQVFTPEGKFITQAWVNRAGPASASTCGLAFSPDKEQKYLYVTDFGNAHVAVLDRKSLTTLYEFAQRGDAPGQFQGAHLMATDSHNNIYIAEVMPQHRAQKFVFKGFSKTMPANALTAAQLAAPPAAQ